MAHKKIREYHSKRMIAKALNIPIEVALVDEKTDWEALVQNNPWLKEKKLVVKPDQLFGRRGKNNLVLLDANLDETKKFVEEKIGKEMIVGNVKGRLSHFLIEPFVKHSEEYYLSIITKREEDSISFSTKGGVDVEEHWHKMTQTAVPIGSKKVNIEIEGVPENIKEKITEFINKVYNFFVKYDFVYLEMNPLTFNDKGELAPLDIVAEVDDTAKFKNIDKWKKLEFPKPFGRELFEEEKFVSELDVNSGASLKLTVLNPNGRIWPLVAGGGASVIYADTVVDLDQGKELAIYGEYSGNPNEEETYHYTSSILDLMTKNGNSNQVLLIGGGVANFTDVGKTFKGIIRALKSYSNKLLEKNVKILVRRGGPNYQEGLKMMEKVGSELGIPIEVFGPETHMTKIVSLGLNGKN